MKQIATALIMYIGDNDDIFPTINDSVYKARGYNAGNFGRIYSGQEWAWDADFAANYSVKAQLSPYIKSENMWKCPSDVKCKPSVVPGQYYSSYVYKHLLFATFLPEYEGTYMSVDPSLWHQALSLGQFPKPGQTWVFRENQPYHDYRPYPPVDPSVAYNTFYDDVKWNVCFMDGHAKTMAISKVFKCWKEWGAPDHQYDFNWSGYGEGWAYHMKPTSWDVAD